jgi:hypothetical protein
MYTVPQPAQEGTKVSRLLIVLAVLASAATIAGCGGGASKPHSRHHAVPLGCCTESYTVAPAVQTDTSTPTPSPTKPKVVKTRTVRRIVFSVTGSGYPDITYGSDLINDSPNNGGGTALPWYGSIKYEPNALYFDVTAQLQGSGQITCTVGVRVTVYYSNHTHKSRSRVITRGHASGGFNICNAQTA